MGGSGEGGLAPSERQIGQCEGQCRFGDDGAPQGDAGIVPPLYDERRRLPRAGVEGLLR